MGKGKIQAEPYEFDFDLNSTALVMMYYTRGEPVMQLEAMPEGD